MRIPEIPPVGSPAELLLLALVLRSDEEAQVRFVAREVAALLEWGEGMVTWSLTGLVDRGNVWPLEPDSDLYQISAVTLRELRRRALREVPWLSAASSAVDAAHALLPRRLQA